MKEFKILKNGGIYYIKNDSAHNNLSNFLTILNMAGYKKSNSFTYCNLSKNENMDITVKEFLLENSALKDDFSLEQYFRNKNAVKLYELINHRLNDNTALKLLSISDFNLLCIVKALVANNSKPVFLDFQEEIILSQFSLNRIFSYIEDCLKNHSLSLFISGCYPRVFNRKFHYTISRSIDSKFSFTKCDNTPSADESIIEESKISA